MFIVFPLLYKSLKHYLTFYLSSIPLFSFSQQADGVSFNWVERRHASSRLLRFISSSVAFTKETMAPSIGR